MDGQIVFEGPAGAGGECGRAGGDVAAWGGGSLWGRDQDGDRLGSQYRQTGRVAALPRGGRRPKKLVGAYREWLVQRCRERDFTLRGLVGELADRGLRVDYRVVWAFVHAEKLSHKKRR